MRNQKLELPLLTFLLLINFLSARIWAYAGGSEAGNGGGLAEKNLIYAQLHIAEYLDLCLQTNSCHLNTREKVLLEKISSSMPIELKTHLQFRSEIKDPGFFIIDGLPRIAKTGNKIGDPIYINTDLLYQKSPNSSYQTADIPLAASILVHELGHHHGEMSHTELDQLGTKIQNLLLTHSLRAEFWNGNAALLTFQKNSVRSDEDKKHLHFIDRLVLENEQRLYELDEAILANLECPDRTQKPLGLRLYNVHEERGVTFDTKSQKLMKPVVVWYILSCNKGKESDHGNIRLELNFNKRIDKTFEFLPNQLVIKQESCFLFKTACK
jgi:hypothetical protein